MPDIDKLSGRDLDAQVAVRVMSWGLDPNQKAADGSPLVLRELPRFSEDAAMARGISFTVEQRHPGTVMRMESMAPFRVVLRGPSGRNYEGVDDDEATAICRAMVKLMDGEGPGIPIEHTKPDRSPRAKLAAADLLSAKAHPHQTVGILAQAIALKEGDRKAGAAIALFQYAAAGTEIVPVVAEQAAKPDPEVAAMCVATLERLAAAGAAATQALAKLRS